MVQQLLKEPSSEGFKKRQKLEKNYEFKKKVNKKYLRDQIIKHSRIDLLMTECLDYKVIDFHLLMWHHRNNNYFKLGNQRMHLALAPRNTGKSVTLTQASIILDIVQNPNIRILIASKTNANSESFLQEIKNKMLSTKFKEVFGDYKGELWNTAEINVLPRTADHKEKTVETVGIGTAIASRHYDKIYADDLVDEDNSTTQGQREKIENWYLKVLYPVLMADGELSNIGTRYHPEDLNGTLIEKFFVVRNKRGKIVKKLYIRVPALIRKKNHRSFKKKVDKYLSIWPEIWSVKTLFAMRKALGSISFNSQYQNDVKAMKGKIFKIDWFRTYSTNDNINFKDLIIYQGCDLAISQKATADKFAHVTIGVNRRTGKIYVLDYFNGIVHYNKQKEILFEKYNQFDPIKAGVEINGYQQALYQDMRANPKTSGMRIVPIFTDKDKTVRAWKMSAYFERGDVLLKEGMNELRDQLIKMPDGRYKDLFDALDIAIQLAFGTGQIVRQTEPGVI